MRLFYPTYPPIPWAQDVRRVTPRRAGAQWQALAFWREFCYGPVVSRTRAGVVLQALAGVLLYGVHCRVHPRRHEDFPHHSCWLTRIGAL